MKNLLHILAALCVAIAASAQPTTPIKNARLSGTNYVIDGGTLSPNGGTIIATPGLTLDLLGTTRGAMLYRGASGWTLLPPSTAGYVLRSGGAGADPSWVVGIPGSVSWGAIQGTLSSQSDLQAALNAKAASGANADITSLSTLSSITRTGNLTITPTGIVDVQGTGIVYASSESNAAEFLAWTYHPTAFPIISGFRARGTRASPTAVQNEDSLLQLGGGGYDGVSFPPANAAEIWFEATENWSVGANGARLAFYVTENGESAVDHIRLTTMEGFGGGRMGVGLVRPDLPATKLTVKDSGNTFSGFFTGQDQANGVALGTSGSNLAQINAYSEVNDALSAVQTLGLQIQGGNLTVGNASSVVSINGGTAATTTLNGSMIVGNGTATASIGIGGGVLRVGNNTFVTGNTTLGTPGVATGTRLDVYEGSSTFAATFRGNGQTNLVAIGTSGSGLAQINGYNQTFGAVQTLGLQIQGGNLTLGNSSTVTTFSGTTEATTAGAGAVISSGGIYSAGKIVGASTFIPIANSSVTTAQAGEFAFDTNAWATSRGAIQVYDGTANTYLIGALASDTPTNRQSPMWNTGGTVTWETRNASVVSSYRTGTAVLVDGTVTVSDAATTANTIIRISYGTLGGTPGAVTPTARVPSTSFTLTSANALDTSTIYYEAWEP